MVDNGTPKRFTSVISETLGIDCCALCGANVARDIAEKKFCETTIGYTSKEVGLVWQHVFFTPYFRVNGLPDVAGVEISGALKNVVALSVGFCEGVHMGSNTVAAVMRIGVAEMRKFAQMFFDDILEETFLDSCGWADLVTTCKGGRHAKCSVEFVRRWPDGKWSEIERDLLSGQKLQGHLTATEVYSCLVHHDLLHFFPLFTTTYRVAHEGRHPSEIVKMLEADEEMPLFPNKSDLTPCRLMDAEELAVASRIKEKERSPQSHHHH
eukprot:GHVU01144383.1.p2 GENE.GHVU01144383.1~~GHVU01144383.1.p2  ORF type:complete len:267 (-),score=56.15 GHVU01144383.1:1287-2087(-)